MDRSCRAVLLVLPLLFACETPPLEEHDGGTDAEIAAEDLCARIVDVVCRVDARCCGTTSPRCDEEQTDECEAAIQPLVDDPRLGYDPAGGAALIASLEARGESCGSEPLDYAALLDTFAGTGVAGADCTPPDLSTASLRISALSCAGDLACRLHLRADGTSEGECAARADDACSHPLDCGADQFCSLPEDWRPGVWGTCRPLRADGWACESDLECASRHCDGTCGAPRSSALCLSTSYRDLVLESAPLAYLPLDEGEGTLASDVTGNLNGGTLTATAMRDAAGAIGREPSEPIEPLPDAGPAPLDGGVPEIEDGASIRFASDDAAVRVAAMSELEDVEALTVEAWIRPDSAETRGPILELNDAAQSGLHVWTHARGDQLFVNFVGRESEPRTVTSSEGAVSPGAWHHVAATWDGATGRLYLDGHLVGEIAAPAPLALTGDLFIGHRPSGEMPLSFRGSIDEVAVYDHALDAAELRRHHAAGPTGLTHSRFALFRWLAR